MIDRAIPTFSPWLWMQRRSARPIDGHRNLRRERAELLSLDDQLLKDIGITRDMALSEARRMEQDMSSLWRIIR